MCRIGDWDIPGKLHVDHKTPDEWYHQHRTVMDQIQQEAANRTLKQAEQEDVEEEKEFHPAQLVLRKNHTLSNKLEGYHAGLAPKWLRPFEVEKRLGNGVLSLKTTLPTNRA